MISALKLYDVIDRGVPNKERIPIQILSDYYMQNLWLGIGVMHTLGQLTPINDNCLWLGTGWVKQGDWLFVYSGKGVPQTNQLPNQESKTYTFHWNRNSVLFASSEIHPYLLEGSIALPPAASASNYLEIMRSLTSQQEEQD